MAPAGPRFAHVRAGCGQIHQIHHHDQCRGTWLEPLIPWRVKAWPLPCFMPFKSHAITRNPIFQSHEIISSHEMPNKSSQVSGKSSPSWRAFSCSSHEVSSLLASIFSLQMLFNAATLHEQVDFKGSSGSLSLRRFSNRSQKQKATDLAIYHREKYRNTMKYIDFPSCRGVHFATFPKAVWRRRAMAAKDEICEVMGGYLVVTTGLTSHGFV